MANKEATTTTWRTTVCTLLDSLKKYTTVVADTGDIEAIAAYKPQDATTNPSLLFQAAQKPQYAHLVERPADPRSPGRRRQGPRPRRSWTAVGRLRVPQILKIVPGRVSTEVDAGLSFDTEGTLAKARKLIGLYEKAGVDREPHPDQDRQHLGGHPRRRAARDARASTAT